MIVLRERNGQALVKITDSNSSVKFEWWYDTQKMYDGVRMEEKNNKTHIYCYIFNGSEKESWLLQEFDKRVPKVRVV
ncbi:MAG: hypothetical protein ACOZCL_09420 [Bacillota bacterium]